MRRAVKSITGAVLGIGRGPPRAEADGMSAFVVGVVTARDPACTRGVAANIAASLARTLGVSNRVCVIDADPFNRDVTTRFAIRGPAIEDFGQPGAPPPHECGRWDSPPCTVVPCAGDRPGPVRAGLAGALGPLAAAHDVVVIDLPAGPMGPLAVVGERLAPLDCLLVGVTPAPESVAAARHFLEQFAHARALGDIGPVPLEVICTGDEGSCECTCEEVGAALGVEPAGRVHQWWGRAVPNLGFGPTLPIAELDAAVVALCERIAAPLEPLITTS